MLCKLWSKVTSVFLNIKFCAKMSILGQKNWNCVRSVDCALLLSVNMLLENMPIFRKLWLFVWMSIYIKKLPKSEKKLQFFLGNVYLYFICWEIVILIQNIILFGDILDKSVIFLVKFTFQVVYILSRNRAVFWEKVLI